MADYAGAVAAIRARLVANWSTTPIAFQNEPFEPPVDSSGNLSPWVFLEVRGRPAELRGVGTPGDHIYLYEGDILIHVFTPVNSGVEIAQQYAEACGEIFRSVGFYNDGLGSIVRTWAPWTDGGGTDADNGNWFRMTCIIPFEFFYRG